MDHEKAIQKVIRYLDHLIYTNKLSDAQVLNLQVMDLSNAKELENIDLSVIYEVLMKYKKLERFEIQ